MSVTEPGEWLDTNCGKLVRVELALVIVVCHVTLSVRKVYQQ